MYRVVTIARKTKKNEKYLKNILSIVA